MKTFALLLITILFSCNSFSQTNCNFSSGPNVPPTPYSGGFLMFDGKGDFVRTNDDDRIDLLYSQTDNFTIETRFKITGPYKPMRILGKYYGTGWALTYHMIQSGHINFHIGTAIYDVYTPGTDTSWHIYKICFSKAESTLRIYVDGNLTHEYTSFTYANTGNDASFSIGNAGLAPAHGGGSVNVYDNYFKGCVDFFRLDKNSTRLLSYDFDEGAGQFAMDSTSYYLTDRTKTGIFTCGDLHLMLGFMPSSDTCDPAWVSEGNPAATNFAPLSTGLGFFSAWNGDTSYSESTSLALTIWNNTLVTGGLINRAGGNVTKYIAGWDGSSWHAIGDGFNHEVKCLTSFNGELYAGGFFDIANGFGERNHIARWDGTEWKALDIGTDNVVTTMMVYRNQLIVGGFFMSAGQNYSPKIASWDGSEWHSMGYGMSGPVYALCEYNGWLYAAGSFQYAGTKICNSIARWGERGWEPVGTGTSGGSGEIYSLCVYNGEMWAGGSFLNMNGVPARNIARYNGSVWSSAGQGASGINCVYTQGYVTSMKVYNNALYAAGEFTKMDGSFANKIARYNGINWCPVEFGADLCPRAMEVFKGSLVISGDFCSLSGREFGNIASYNVPSSTSPESDKLNDKDNKFKLEQNYPNPFNPSTNIRFTIPGSLQNYGNVQVRIYDITGREAAVVVNEALNPGTYEFKWDGTGYSSGIYYYKLICGNYAETKKMLLVK